MSQPAVTYMQQAFYYMIRIQESHPYRFSFVLSCVIVALILFTRPSDEVDESSFNIDNTRIINIDSFSPPKRKAKQEVTTDVGAEIDQEVVPVERAEGSIEDGEAVDIAFYTDVVPPKPLVPLKRLYPLIARQKNIEALVNVEMLIGEEGIIKKVSIIGVRLSKELPQALREEITRAFIQDTIKILMGARFTPPVVEGKRRAIKMELPLQFKLE